LSLRILIIEDFPQTAGNIARVFGKKLLENSNLNGHVRIDIAHNLPQAANYLAVASESGNLYAGVIVDYVMLGVSDLRERLLREKRELERISIYSPDSHILTSILQRYKSIDQNISVLKLKHHTPPLIQNLLQRQGENSNYSKLLNSWNTGPIIGFLKYNYPQLPLLICTGRTFERENIIKDLKINEQDFKHYFQIRFLDKPFLNRNPHLYEEFLELEPFIELIQRKQNQEEGELLMNTSDITANLLFFDLMMDLVQIIKEEKESLREDCNELGAESYN
jgi:hypothetical protein